MKAVIILVVTIIKAIFGDKNKMRDKKRVKEDKELAEAIRNGDSKTVGKIRERRKKYKNL